MTGALNGHANKPEMRETVARTVIEAMRGNGDDQPSFDELDPDEQASELWLAEQYVTAHVAYLMDGGFRILPPGAAPIPRTQEEAMAMLQAAKGFFDAQKRKGRLMNTGPRGLVAPDGSKLQ